MSGLWMSGCPKWGSNHGYPAAGRGYRGTHDKEDEEDCTHCGIGICFDLGDDIGIGQIQKKKAADEAEKAKKEYATNLNTITYTMLDACSTAEECGNLIKSVWSNAIYEESDDETDKYTKPDGYYVSDFNDALGNLFADSSFSAKVKSVSDKQESVNTLMKKMKNPPEEYKEAYEKMQEFYDAYIALTNLATDPTGSLQTYSTSFNDADTDASNCYKAMKVYLEE